MSTIQNIFAREVVDSRGNPTVEVEVTLDNGIIGTSIVPSGASTGIYEAHELRDEDPKRYGGKGVIKAVNNVNKIIAPVLIGMDPTQQKTIDEKMIALDGTENKEKLGANAILAVSIAVCKTGAVTKNVPLYQHIGDLGDNKEFILPVPMVLVLEGGKHADQSSDFQEFMVIPTKAPNFKEGLRRGSEIYHAIGKVLQKQGYNINVGFE
jgi:enolase